MNQSYLVDHNEQQTNTLKRTIGHLWWERSAILQQQRQQINKNYYSVLKSIYFSSTLFFLVSNRGIITSLASALFTSVTVWLLRLFSVCARVYVCLSVRECMLVYTNIWKRVQHYSCKCTVNRMVWVVLLFFFSLSIILLLCRWHLSKAIYTHTFTRNRHKERIQRKKIIISKAPIYHSFCVVILQVIGEFLRFHVFLRQNFGFSSCCRRRQMFEQRSKWDKKQTSERKTAKHFALVDWKQNFECVVCTHAHTSYRHIRYIVSHCTSTLCLFLLDEPLCHKLLRTNSQLIYRQLLFYLAHVLRISCKQYIECVCVFFSF